MRWKKVYQVQYPGAAERVRGWLEEHGITVQTRGTQLAGASGEIPVQEAWPSLWVPEDLQDASDALIARYEAEAAAPRPDWTCASCGEEVEGTFGSCWSCGADAPAVDALGES